MRYLKTWPVGIALVSLAALFAIRSFAGDRPHAGSNGEVTETQQVQAYNTEAAPDEQLDSAAAQAWIAVDTLEAHIEAQAPQQFGERAGYVSQDPGQVVGEWVDAAQPDQQEQCTLNSSCDECAQCTECPETTEGAVAVQHDITPYLSVFGEHAELVRHLVQVQSENAALKAHTAARDQMIETTMAAVVENTRLATRAEFQGELQSLREQQFAANAQVAQLAEHVRLTQQITDLQRRVAELQGTRVAPAYAAGVCGVGPGQQASPYQSPAPSAAFQYGLQPYGQALVPAPTYIPQARLAPTYIPQARPVPTYGTPYDSSGSGPSAPESPWSNPNPAAQPSVVPPTTSPNVPRASSFGPAAPPTSSLNFPAENSFTPSATPTIPPESSLAPASVPAPTTPSSFEENSFVPGNTGTPDAEPGEQRTPRTGN
ncbi:MAG: hypothetical protein QGG36_31375 [Pirellulaceae bacterium]|jgi:hypothetical protein|nr:hypothetical protein [Pirellulaceae bacterium]MDP7020341.1 hypothetical protein [Pirellulaceae bacterium]